MTPNASYLGKTVDEMLLDAGQAQATELRAALLSLGTLASLPVPAPNAQLAALMAGPHDLVRQRWLRKHRAAVVGLAVVAGMGFGVTGVAASASGQGRQSSMSVQHMLEGWAPSWTIAAGPSASAAGLLPDPQPATHHEPVPAVQSVPAPPEQPLTGQDQSAAEAEGTAKKDDGGAPTKDPASAAGTEAQSREATESRTAEEAAAKTQEEGVRGLGEEQNQTRPTQTRAGKAEAGASWLKKFSR